MGAKPEDTVTIYNYDVPGLKADIFSDGPCGMETLLLMLLLKPGGGLVDQVSPIADFWLDQVPEPAPGQSRSEFVRPTAVRVTTYIHSEEQY